MHDSNESKLVDRQGFGVWLIHDWLRSRACVCVCVCVCACQVQPVRTCVCAVSDRTLSEECRLSCQRMLLCVCVCVCVVQCLYSCSVSVRARAHGRSTALRRSYKSTLSSRHSDVLLANFRDLVSMEVSMPALRAVCWSDSYSSGENCLYYECRV